MPGDRRRPTGGRQRRCGHGVLATGLLLLVAEQGGHGYGLAARLEELGFDALDPGGLYRRLRVLETDGLLSSWWDGSDRGPARRVYQLTPAGRSYLAGTIDALADEARLLATLVDRFCSAQPS